MILASVTVKEACTSEISADGTVTIRPVTCDADGGTGRSSAAVPARDPEPKQAATPPEPQTVPSCETETDKAAHRRELARARTKRWRERKRHASVTDGVTRDAVTRHDGIDCLDDCLNININTNTNNQTSNQPMAGDGVTCDGDGDAVTAPAYCGRVERCRDTSASAGDFPPDQTVLPWYDRPPAATKYPRATVAAHAVRADTLPDRTPEAEELIQFPRGGQWVTYPELDMPEIRKSWDSWRKWRCHRAKTIRWRAYCEIWDELAEIYADAGPEAVVRCLVWAKKTERVSVFACPRAVYAPEDEAEQPAGTMYYAGYTPEEETEPEQTPEEKLSHIDREIEFFCKMGFHKLEQDARKQRAALVASIGAEEVKI